MEETMQNKFFFLKSNKKSWFLSKELLLILDEYWAEHPELHDVPIYYASSLAKKCMMVYQTYTDAMNSKIRKQFNKRNPFKFAHITNLKSIEQFDDQVKHFIAEKIFR